MIGQTSTGLKPKDALAAIRALAIQQLPLTLVTSYKGMLFEQTLMPRKVAEDGLHLPLPKAHLCATQNEVVYLHSRFLPATVRAFARWQSAGEPEVCLTYLRFLNSRWQPRLEQRVQPERPLPATVWIERMPFEAIVTDLAVRGVGLLFDPHLATPPTMLRAGLPVEVVFHFSADFRLTLSAEVVYMRRAVEDWIWRVGVRVYPTPEQQRWLESYVARRRVKIYEELEQRARLLMEPPATPDLYF